jgi:hypothetical protein
MGGSSTSAGSNMSNGQGAAALLSAGAGFSASSTGSDGAGSGLSPNQSPAIAAQNEFQFTGGRSTRILMLIVWTLSLRNQRQRRFGRRSPDDKAIRLK